MAGFELRPDLAYVSRDPEEFGARLLAHNIGQGRPPIYGALLQRAMRERGYNPLPENYNNDPLSLLMDERRGRY